MDTTKDRQFLLDLLNPVKTPNVPQAQRDDARRLLRGLETAEEARKILRK